MAPIVTGRMPAVIVREQHNPRHPKGVFPVEMLLEAAGAPRAGCRAR
jgi:hypothetical protein